MDGPYTKHVFNLIRNRRAVFPGGCTIVHSHQRCMRVPVASHPHQHLVLLVLFSCVTSLSNRRWYLTVVLVCISLMTSDTVLVCCPSSFLGDPLQCFAWASFSGPEVECLHTTGLFLLYPPAHAVLES